MKLGNHIKKVKDLLKQKDKYQLKISEEFIMPLEISNYLKNSGFNFRFNLSFGPSAFIIVTFNSYKDGNFEIDYSYHLHISKLAPICFEEFPFNVKNLDPREMIGGVINLNYYEPMVIEHSVFVEGLRNILISLNYQVLTETEIDGVVELNNTNYSEIYGKQTTLRMLFFEQII